ncbi:hypothetical protein BV22DRAFT_745366 [Leucogyrophana mollusca]|uniref:Uncharacterized protein n=1 Tax=Leucogyrophana mollusca TaxID=85980 RepID=A0ACB8B748_9AGAM|nr:hypothetical protein BV22DRAFT_745366 [Leucogyrophana mollusca]
MIRAMRCATVNWRGIRAILVGSHILCFCSLAGRLASLCYRFPEEFFRSPLAWIGPGELPWERPCFLYTLLVIGRRVESYAFQTRD